MASYGLSSFSLSNHMQSVIGATAAQLVTAAATPTAVPSWYLQNNVVNPQSPSSTTLANDIEGNLAVANGSNPSGKTDVPKPALFTTIENSNWILTNYAHWM